MMEVHGADAGVHGGLSEVELAKTHLLLATEQACDHRICTWMASETVELWMIQQWLRENQTLIAMMGLTPFA